MNADIVTFAVFALVLVVAAVAALILNLSGRAGTRMERRLERIRARFDPKKMQEMRQKSILLDKGGTALEQMLREILPRPAELRKRLEKTGKNIAMDRYVIACVVVFFVTAFFLTAATGQVIFGLLVGVVAGLGLPHFAVGRMIRARLNKFTSLFPEAIDLIVRGLKSGLPVIESIGVAGREIEDPVGIEFRRIADSVRLGKTLDQAMWDASNRLDTPDFRFFVISLAIQQETGGNLSETLGNLADILRKRQGLKLKIKALSSEGKASAYIVGSLPFIMCAIILAVNYDYGITLFTDKRATLALAGGGVWLTIGFGIIWRMINFEI